MANDDILRNTNMAIYKKLREKAKTMPYIIILLILLILIIFPKNVMNKSCIGVAVLRSLGVENNNIVIRTTCFGIPF